MTRFEARGSLSLVLSASFALVIPRVAEAGLQARFDTLTKSTFDEEHAVAVPGGRWSDAHADVVFGAGTSIPLRAGDGSAIGAHWIGPARIRYTPPPGTERSAWKRTTGLDRLDAEADQILVVTDDPSLLAVLLPDGTAVKAAKITPFAQFMRKVRSVGAENEVFHTDLAHAVLLRDGRPDGGGVRFVELVAQVSGLPQPPRKPPPEAPDWFTYLRDPAGPIEAGEQVAAYVGHYGWEDRRWTTAAASHAFGADSDAEPASPSPAADLLIVELDLDIDAGFRPAATLRGQATLRFRAARALEVIPLELLRSRTFEVWDGPDQKLGFSVESVSRDGVALDTLHEGTALLIALDKPAQVGEEFTVEVHWSGDAVQRLTQDSWGLLANFAWWPQPAGRDRYTFATTICVPSALRAVGTGARIKQWEDGKRRCEAWNEPTQIGFPAINIGRWVQRELAGPRGVTLRASFLAADSGQMEPALQEASRILTAYERMFGPYPYSELDLAQAVENQGFWQAPAGLVELSRSSGAVQRSAERYRLGQFVEEGSTAILAHEIAHQWWGHKVGWTGYRSQWVSEAFSEYSSFLVCAELFGREDAQGRLDYWREIVALLRDHPGSATLGYRQGRLAQVLFYQKVPYVLHTLRRMVGNDALLEFMRTLADAANSRDVSNADVRAVGEHVLGPDFGWFWDQWIAGTEIPSLDVSAHEEGGQVTLTVRQLQAPPMRLILDLALSGKRGKPVVHTVHLDAALWTGTVPGPPGGLRAVDVDPDGTLLTEKVVARVE